MTRARARAWILLLCLSLLQACGGGGGGDSDDGGNPPPQSNTRLSITPDHIDVGATPGELGPTARLTLTIQNPPTDGDGLWVATGHSANGLETIDFNPTSPNQASLTLTFREPGILENNTYEDALEIHVCFDDQCQREIRDSPQTIQTSYQVSGDGLATAALGGSIIAVTADQREFTARSGTAPLTLDVLPPSGVIARAIESSPAIEFAGVGGSNAAREVFVEFVPGNELDLGNYDDQIAVTLCYHESCVRQVRGSPFTIDTSLTVSLGVEPGLAPLQVASLAPLGHDVIASEFNETRNEIVMVGRYPVNTIYVYDVATGIESSQALSLPPTSVSIAPDGQTAAAGHAFKVSIIDLAMVGAAGAPAPVLVDISTNVGQLILDGAGHVHAIEPVQGGGFLTSLDIASNTEQQIEFAHLRAIRLHPSGNAIYGATIFGELVKWDISSGIAARLYNWPYLNEHDHCWNLWLSESGSAIYTACGETFQTSTIPAEDMLYTGRLPLTPHTDGGDTTVTSLSSFTAAKEIALIKANSIVCDPGISFRPCFTRIAYHDDLSLARKAIYGIGPITVGGTPYAQLGRFMFHDTSGKKFLISEIENPPSDDLRFWLSEIP